MAALGVALDVSSGPELRILANLLTERFFFLRGFCAYRSCIYGRSAPSAIPCHTVADGPEGRAHGSGKADYDACDFFYGRLYG